MTAVRLLISISVCIVIMAAGLVRAEDSKLTVFAAGSLREALGVIEEDFEAAHKIQIRTEFGPSGRLRERIERGEHADLFASADTGHARTLVEQGRATVMAMFARNSICALAAEELGLTEATIVDKLLDKATKIGISTPRLYRRGLPPDQPRTCRRGRRSDGALDGDRGAPGRPSTPLG